MITTTIIPGPAQPADDRVRGARVLLARACRGMPTPTLSAAVAELGPVATVQTLRADPAAGRLRYGVTLTEADEDLAERDLAAGARVDARFLVPEDGGWPDLAVIARPRGTGSPDSGGGPAAGTAPVLGLWVRGRAPLVGGPRVAVVGSRAASEYGHHVARDWSARLAEHGVRIVTGGALGIETEALRGAVPADGAPVVVTPCGIDHTHPASNAALFDDVVARGGVIVTPYPPGSAARQDRMLGRQPLLAGLADAVLVVEAASRSTALTTAGHAHQHHRAVLVVPGPVTSTASAGAHRLAREPWAQLVGTADDVLTDLAAHAARQRTDAGVGHHRS